MSSIASNFNGISVFIAWFVFIAAAILEVAGDAMIRHGLRERGIAIGVLGFLVLGCYGVVVNMLRWDFSKLLGTYVAVFALVSILAGRIVFGERVAPATWVGLAVIVCGGLIIQFG